MTPLNLVMNHVANMAESDALLTKIGIRTVTIVGVIPLEVMAAAFNLIKLPFEAALMVTKIPLKITNLLARSKALRSVEMALPGPKKVIVTALKIIGFVLGTLFTVVLGVFISPKMNFDLHVSLGLVRNAKAEAHRAQIELQIARRRAAVAQQLEDNIKRIALANKARIEEKERLVALEHKRQRETWEATNAKPEASQPSDHDTEPGMELQTPEEKVPEHKPLDPESAPEGNPAAPAAA